MSIDNLDSCVGGFVKIKKTKSNEEDFKKNKSKKLNKPSKKRFTDEDIEKYIKEEQEDSWGEDDY